MPDYKESTNTITSWQRCYRITIENPYGAMPSVRFDEEMCTSADGKSTSNVTGCIVQNFDDPAHTFPLCDPQTGEPTGATMTHGELYAVLWSLYMALAVERDAQLNT